MLVVITCKGLMVLKIHREEHVSRNFQMHQIPVLTFCITGLQTISIGDHPTGICIRLPSSNNNLSKQFEI